MPAPSPIRDILEAIGLAIAREIIRLLDASGRSPLRQNSKLKQQLLSGEAVKVKQGRNTRGQFSGFDANATLELYALDYLQWVDSGRKPGGKKVPISAILEFIRNRNLQPRGAKGRFARPGRINIKGKNGKADTSINKLAFLIQRSIFLNGIRARPVIAPAFDLGQSLVDIYLNENLLDAMTFDIDEQLRLGFINSN